MRTCIICLPRTGSQWCERLIGSANESTLRLGEFFENWNVSTYEVSDSLLYCKDFKAWTQAPLGMSQYKDRIAKLKQAENKHITIRLFLYDDYDKDILAFIVYELSNLGFDFIGLTRNIKDQLLSFMVARFQPFGVPSFAINHIINVKATVDIKIMEPLVEHIVRSNNNRELNINLLFPNREKKIHTVHYETLINDLSLVYNKTLTFNGNKSVEGDHLDWINNKEEVLALIDKYI